MSAVKVYEFYKNKWETTKPIRGRSEEIRPVGKRRRDWEKIIRKELGNGEYSYCIVLYQTECVEYLPDGSVKLRAGGWPTPSTAEFIYEHSPFTCFKRNKKLWIKVSTDTDEVKTYPLGEGELHLLHNKSGRYEPAEPVVIRKQVVNRAKAKAARADVMAFLDWSRTMLKISDGWVMHETMKQVFGWKEGKPNESNNWDSHGYVDPYMCKDNVLLELCQSENDDDKLLALCRIANHSNKEERRKAESFMYEMEWNGNKFMRSNDFYDMRVKFDTIKRYVYKLVEKSGDIHDIVEVQPTDKTMTGVI